MTLNHSIIKSLMLKCYLLESLWSVTQFKKNFGICYTEYVDAATPIVDFGDCFHPCLSLDRVVKNDICLGTSPANNAILTGPNAGGKSTFVKCLIINALLAQTVGICVSSRARLTPFAIINSQINIPDCKGYESLFEAEMYRCKHKLDLLKQYADKRCLFVMDEIFNSTNPVEGIAGAYAIAKKIAEHTNCILVFTTHYVYLTKLHKTGRFVNLKMNVVRGEGDDISYPYKLVSGVSRQYIALDLLKKNGFDEEIITEALGIKERLTNRV
jgi:DNA mismatch repair protein MutS